MASVEKQIGAQLARIRRERGLTQAELAELIDVTTETVSRLERGVSIPSLKTIENVGNALNIHIRDIFDFEYTPRLKVAAVEKETAKLTAFLRTLSIKDLSLIHEILAVVFKKLKA